MRAWARRSRQAGGTALWRVHRQEPMTHPSVGAAGTHPGPDVVAFGMLTWFNNFMVDRPPVPNTGDYIRGSWNHIGDDATIVAALVRSWGLSSGIIGTALGNDEGSRTWRREETQDAHHSAHGHFGGGLTRGLWNASVTADRYSV